jgi:hypothetical protein
VLVLPNFVFGKHNNYHTFETIATTLVIIFSP